MRRRGPAGRRCAVGARCSPSRLLLRAWQTATACPSGRRSASSGLRVLRKPACREKQGLCCRVIAGNWLKYHSVPAALRPPLGPSRRRMATWAAGCLHAADRPDPAFTTALPVGIDRQQAGKRAPAAAPRMVQLPPVSENRGLYAAAAVTAAVGGGLLLRRALRCGAAARCCRAAPSAMRAQAARINQSPMRAATPRAEPPPSPPHGLNQRCRQTKPLAGPYTPDTLPKGAYDVIIVGAGQQAAVGVAAATAAAAAACCLPPLASQGSLPSPAMPHPLRRSPRPLRLRGRILPGQGRRPRGPAGQGAGLFLPLARCCQCTPAAVNLAALACQRVARCMQFKPDAGAVASQHLC